MSNNGSIKIRPSHFDLTAFFQVVFPPHPRDVPLLYHTPRHPRYDPSVTPVNDLVLSITPTSGVYTKLSELSSSPLPLGSARRPFHPKPACFLHRPFSLDRRAVPRGTLVLSSHKRFDELLTVGWNIPLAERLGLDVSRAVCIQGYKGDPERRIGLIAGLPHSGTKTIGDFRAAIVREFGLGDLHIGHEMQAVEPKEGSSADNSFSYDTEIAAVAIMNAFGPDEVARAISSAIEANFIPPDQGYRKMLYLTGEAKQAGLAVLNEKYQGMVAICVGHRPVEEWGIKYLSECVRQRWADLNVHVVLEEEEPPPNKKAESEEDNSPLNLAEPKAETNAAHISS